VNRQDILCALWLNGDIPRTWGRWYPDLADRPLTAYQWPVVEIPGERQQQLWLCLHCGEEMTMPGIYPTIGYYEYLAVGVECEPTYETICCQAWVDPESTLLDHYKPVPIEEDVSADDSQPIGRGR
jgi:hypothetical protein